MEVPIPHKPYLVLGIHEECRDATYSRESLVLPSFGFDQASVIVLYVDPFGVEHPGHERVWSDL